MTTATKDYPEVTPKVFTKPGKCPGSCGKPLVKWTPFKGWRRFKPKGKPVYYCESKGCTRNIAAKKKS